jgi:ABC-type protease/lipase transport system fused ATPase/permease subunit
MFASCRIWGVGMDFWRVHDPTLGTVRFDRIYYMLVGREKIGKRAAYLDQSVQIYHSSHSQRH